jgi:threonine dehydratase
MRFSAEEIETAQRIVYDFMLPTPTYSWATLHRRLGFSAFVKHENHTPIGSFKLRGGLVYVEFLQRSGMSPKGMVTATRGNHGQSIAVASKRRSLPLIVVVPEGNSTEKNAAMTALGATVEIAGSDFDECRAIAEQRQNELGYHYVPSFHRLLVLGVSTYADELFRAHGDLDRVYVPIGMGSGICGLISARNRLGLTTEIIGVVADRAPAFARSVEAGYPIATISADTIADGMACREPQPEPVEIVRRGAADIVRVGEDEIKDAMRICFTDTHNVAEGAGAAALAAAIQQADRNRSKKVGMIVSGGNVDCDLYRRILEKPISR